MLIRLYLQTVPDDLLVSVALDNNDDQRVIFLVEEYEALIDDGYNLPAISAGTTMGDLKDNLTIFSMQHPKEVQDVLYDFADRYLQNEMTLREKYMTESNKSPRSLKQILIIWIVALFSAMILVVLLAGILSGSLSLTSIFNGILNLFGIAINHAQ